VLVAGCGAFASYHGRSRWCGLLGLLSLAGVLVVLMMALPRIRLERRKGFDVIYAPPYRRDVWRMDVQVMLDDALQDKPTPPIMLQLPRGASIAAAVKTLEPIVPSLRREMSDFKFLLNGQPAKHNEDMSDGDELNISLRRSLEGFNDEARMTNDESMSK